MAIDSNYADRESAAAARRRALEAQRESELQRIETAYNENVKQTEAARGESLAKIYSNQTEEIDRLRNESAHKVTLAAKSADQELKEFQRESQRMTDEASRQFRMKAQTLAQAQSDIEKQRQKILMAHSDSLKKLHTENEAQEVELKHKLNAESQAIAREGTMRIQSETQKYESDLSSQRAQFEETKKATQIDNAIELGKIKDQQKRLEAELRDNEKLEERRELIKLQDLQTKSAARYNAEQFKAESNIEKVRQENTDKLRKLQEAGDRNLVKTKLFYDNEVYQTSKDNEKKLTDARMFNKVEIDQMEKNRDLQKKIMQREHYKKMSDMKGRQDVAEKEYAGKSQAMREKADEQYLIQAKDIHEKRDATIAGLQRDLTNDVARIIGEGKKQVEHAKMETTDAIVAFKSKSDDPFYRLKTLGVSVVERDDGLMLLMEQPAHEQDNVRLSFNPHGLTVTGSRRFEARNQITPGHSVSTNSYQSYSETIPLPYKVEANQMVRSYENGVLRIFLPKSIG